MINEQKRLEVISNNLANSATVGYKAENVTSQSFKDMMAVKIRDGSNAFLDVPIGDMNLGVKIGETYVDWSQGSLRETGNTYDIAIQGNGFFQMRVTYANGNDEIMYSRNGQFTMTKDGFIVDSYGNHLQGSSGDLQILKIIIIVNYMAKICSDQWMVQHRYHLMLLCFRDLQNSLMPMSLTRWFL